jgi:DNA-binding NarL/FixJ family response regulator
MYSMRYCITQNIKKSTESVFLFEFFYVILYTLLISKKEREKTVIEFANEGKTTREIAKQVHISLKDIGKILRKIAGDEESHAGKETEEERNRNG